MYRRGGDVGLRERGGGRENKSQNSVPPPSRPIFTLRPRLASASGLQTPFQEICGQRRRRFLKQKGEGRKEKGWCAQKKFVRWLENWLLKLPPSSMAHPFAFQRTLGRDSNVWGSERRQLIKFLACFVLPPARKSRLFFPARQAMITCGSHYMCYCTFRRGQKSISPLFFVGTLVKSKTLLLCLLP